LTPLQSNTIGCDARWAAARTRRGERSGSDLSSSDQRRSLSPSLPYAYSIGVAKGPIIMVKRPDGMNVFEFAVLSALRAAQLQRGCTPRVERSPKMAVTAQHEVAERKVLAVRADEDPIAQID
jgi:hypothetical protein